MVFSRVMSVQVPSCVRVSRGRSALRSQDLSRCVGGVCVCVHVCELVGGCLHWCSWVWTSRVFFDASVCVRDMHGKQCFLTHHILSG
jgi:hypothetical protein